MGPDKRFDWMKKYAAKIDVLITNARLVEVGLNFVMFSTAVFFELEASFYMLYQVMRRIWRPFAPLLVETYFPVYSDTAEERILDLAGEKILSNQLLTGQEVGGVPVSDDAGNILQMAVNRLLKGIRPKQVLGIFATQNAITASPIGSSTATSPDVRHIMTWDEWLEKYSQGDPTHGSWKMKAISQSQMVRTY
jgi:hypothetical protein